MPQPMIPHEKLRSIAQALLAKTRVGQVNWDRSSTNGEPCYDVTLPHSSISLSYSSPSLEPDFITLELFNENELSVAAWRVDKPDPATQPPNPDWDLLSALFADVHRAVTGWDKVLNEVEEALAGGNQIGLDN